MSDLARRLIEVAAMAIQEADEETAPEPADFFGLGLYGLEATAAVVAVLRELASEPRYTGGRDVDHRVTLSRLADKIQAS